jgi:hypothetical protein
MNLLEPRKAAGRSDQLTLGISIRTSLVDGIRESALKKRCLAGNRASARSVDADSDGLGRGRGSLHSSKRPAQVLSEEQVAVNISRIAPRSYPTLPSPAPISMP